MADCDGHRRARGNAFRVSGLTYAHTPSNKGPLEAKGVQERMSRNGDGHGLAPPRYVPISTLPGKGSVNVAKASFRRRAQSCMRRNCSDMENIPMVGRMSQERGVAQRLVQRDLGCDKLSICKNSPLREAFCSFCFRPSSGCLTFQIPV